MLPTKVLVKRLDVLVKKSKHLERKKKIPNKVKKKKKKQTNRMKTTCYRCMNIYRPPLSVNKRGVTD